MGGRGRPGGRGGGRRTADKRQGACTGAACVFLWAAGGGHGALCIDDAILGGLSRGELPEGPGRTPVKGVRHCHPPEAAWVAAVNLPLRRQRHQRHPRRSHSEYSSPDHGSPARGLPCISASLRNGASVAAQGALSNIPVSARALCSFWALGRYLRAATSRTRDGITTPGSKAPRSDMFGWLSAA